MAENTNTETVEDTGESINELITTYASRVQSLDEEIKGLQEDKREIFKDAKSDGINPTALKKAIANIRKGDTAVFEEEQYEEILKEANVVFKL